MAFDIDIHTYMDDDILATTLDFPPCQKFYQIVQVFKLNWKSRISVEPFEKLHK